MRLNGRLAAGADLTGKFCIADIDEFDQVPERNESNNVKVSQPIFIIGPLTLAAGSE